MTIKSVKMWGVFDKRGNLWEVEFLYSKASFSKRHLISFKIRPVTVTWEE